MEEKKAAMEGLATPTARDCSMNSGSGTRTCIGLAPSLTINVSRTTSMADRSAIVIVAALLLAIVVFIVVLWTYVLQPIPVQ
jgi:hypothetical protein